MTAYKGVCRLAGIMGPLERAIELAGGQTALASAITKHLRPAGDRVIRQAHVWYWLNRSGGRVPPEIGVAIEVALKGAIAREEFNRHLYRRTDKGLGNHGPDCARNSRRVQQKKRATK